MASFRVEWKKSTKRDLRKLPASVAARVISRRGQLLKLETVSSVAGVAGVNS